MASAFTDGELLRISRKRVKTRHLCTMKGRIGVSSARNMKASTGLIPNVDAKGSLSSYATPSVASGNPTKSAPTTKLSVESVSLNAEMKDIR